MTQERLFPATVMPDQDWWHALWPVQMASSRPCTSNRGWRLSIWVAETAISPPLSPGRLARVASSDSTLTERCWSKRKPLVTGRQTVTCCSETQWS